MRRNFKGVIDIVATKYYKCNPRLAVKASGAKRKIGPKGAFV
jgi:hypothetical protein